MQKKKIIFLFLVVIVVAGVLIEKKREENARGDVIRVSGNIEVTNAELSFKIPGKVTERLVTEGDMIKQGQVVARLDSSEYDQALAVEKAAVRKAEAALAELRAGSRPQEIQQAFATMEKARSWLDQLQAGSRPQEIASAEAEVEHARSDMENLEREYKRQDELVREGVSSQEQFDRARTTFMLAVASLKEANEKLKLVREGPRKEEIEQARQSLKEATEHHALVKEGPRKEVIEQARAQLQQSQAGLALAQTRLDYTILFAPFSGTVLSKNVEPGEFVYAGTPVVTAADLQDIWLRAYINETDLGRVKLGQKARVTTDTYPGKVYDGKVSFIAGQAEFTPKNVQTEKERVKLVYRIKIVLSNPMLELKPGMPADAEVLTGRGND